MITLRAKLVNQIFDIELWTGNEPEVRKMCLFLPKSLIITILEGEYVIDTLELGDIFALTNPTNDMKYTVDLDDNFSSELIDLVKELELLGIKTTVPDILVRLAKGHSINDIRNYERSKVNET